MKKALIVMLIAVIAVTSVFAYSDFTAKVGYDLMSFGTTTGSTKFNGLSFGVRGDLDLIDGFCATASVDGFVPFFSKTNSESWAKLDLSSGKAFGLKTKLGASYEIDFGMVDLALGVNGIYGAMFTKTAELGNVSLMNGGIGADVCVDFNVNPHLTLGVEVAPELMFGKTWLISNGVKSTTSGAVQFAGSAQVAATIIF